MSNDAYQLDTVSRVADLPLFATRAPSVRGSVTSAQAADAMGPATLNALVSQVLEYLRQHGPSTDEEMQHGIPMDGNTQRPRRRWLQQNGFIVADGERRTSKNRNAVVWRVV